MFSVSDIIAIFALVVSGISLCKSDQNTRESNRIARDSKVIQKRLLDIEQARETDRINQSLKASLVAEIIGDNQRFLRIENRGLVEARKVKVLINGLPRLEHPKVDNNFPDTPSIPPNSDIRYPLMKNQSMETQEISISWEDDAGPDSKEFPLAF